MENNKKKKHFAEAIDREIKKLVDNPIPRNTKKSTKYAGKIYSAFNLRSESESYKLSKPLSGLLVYWRIMPSAETLSSKFHSCSQSFTSWPTVLRPKNEQLHSQEVKL